MNITRSQDGRLLILASTDGYCTLISFETDELGKPYKHQLPEMLLEGTGSTEKESLSVEVRCGYILNSLLEY
jgi:chromatin assembly factor 1 subunit B